MSTRKPCINVPTATYSGKEFSPLHFGQSAEGFELNTIMEGYDKMMWMVKVKNNRKVWVRQVCENKMVYEEPVIAKEETIVQEINESVKPALEKKKMTDYNAFLTYRLYQLKQQNSEKPNKELFNTVVAEWKELKKNPEELNKVMYMAYESKII